MVFFNYATMQMAAKIVYYGPGLCGKTTNLHHIYAKTSPGSRGEMVSLETETDRTLFFDLLPIFFRTSSFSLRIKVYPGEIHAAAFPIRRRYHLTGESRRVGLCGGAVPARQCVAPGSPGAMRPRQPPVVPPLPGLADGAEAKVTVRSKDKGGRLVSWTADVDEVRPGTELWDTVTALLAKERLNAAASCVRPTSSLTHALSRPASNGASRGAPTI